MAVDPSERHPDHVDAKDYRYYPPSDAATVNLLGRDQASREGCRRDLEERPDAFEVKDSVPPPKAADTDCD